MHLKFSQRPGRRERQLIRKRDNPLFPEAQRHPGSSELNEAQRLDHEELEAFIGRFHTLVHEAVDLQPNVGSEVILDLKERLDQAYEQSAGLADDQSETQAAIARLLDIIMAAVRNGASGDPAALMEIEQETQARSAHFELLTFPLVADLLDPDSPIAEDELAATLLSASEQEQLAVLTLFDPAQREQLAAHAQTLLEAVGDNAPATARQRLAAMR